MVTRQALIAEALTWEGTPYHHCAMLKGVGCDCVGFVAGVAKAVGILGPDWELPTYEIGWHLHKNEQKLLASILSEGGVRTKTPVPGDLLVFKYGRVGSHIGFLLDGDRVIHARRDLGKVRVDTLSGDLGRRVLVAYAIEGLV